jgi:4-amino-4-deoxy-L-arabinose transferase-like glycosyltransferase
MFKQIKIVYILGIILALSGFTHIWNAVGFPDVFFDEGVYMQRAMHVLNGLGPQDQYFHDHPFFGQIFLAASLGLVGFPNSLHPSTDPNSISSLYLVPRIIMGMLAVLDTFLVYKIADTKYGKKIALISSLLFAVMPITWIMRRILLDSILLPFLLSSILLALRTKDSHNKSILVLFSGICLGIAIFTKIPVFVMIPLVASLVYFGTRKNPKTLTLWFLPVILIPLIWPLQAVGAHQFDLWIRDVIWQTQRPSGGLPYISLIFFKIDPVLFILGISGTIFAIIRRDYFILMWFIPYVIFLFMIGYNQYFYWIPVLPVFCISASMLIVHLLGIINKEKLHKVLSLSVVLGIAAFGLVSTVLVISVNLTNTEFEAVSFILQKINDTDTTVLASPTYSWILHYVFNKENIPNDYSFILFNPIKTEKVLLVADPHLLIDLERGKQLQQIYNDSKTVAIFHEDLSKYDMSLYPYSSIKMNLDGEHVEIKMK